MRFIVAIIIAIGLGAFWAVSERAGRQAAEQRADSLQSDNTALVAQLDAADADKAATEKLIADLSEEVAKRHSEADVANGDADHSNDVSRGLSNELTAVTKQRDDALKARDQACKDADTFKAEAEAAKKEAKDAAKLALKAQHDSCPPPEVVPKETQAQEFAPAFERADGTKIWRTDYDWDEAKAKELHRLQFVCWGTRSCPHCDYFLQQCSKQAVGADVFRAYVPCWITVQDKATHDLAEKFGVNKFQYPGAMLRDPVSGKFVLWRPSKDDARLQDEITEHAKGLK